MLLFGTQQWQQRPIQNCRMFLFCVPTCLFVFLSSEFEYNVCGNFNETETMYYASVFAIRRAAVRLYGNKHTEVYLFNLQCDGNSNN